MDKNKSIDGLAPRRPKKATSSSTAKKVKTTKTTKATGTAKTAKSTKTTRATKTAKTTQATQIQSAKATKPTRTARSIRTTKATHSTKASPQESLAAAAVPIQPQAQPKPQAQPEPIADPTADFLKPVQAFDFDEQSGELKATKDPATKKGKKMKEKKPKSKKRKIITGIIIGILSLLLIAGIIFIIWGNDIIAKITGGQGNVFDLIIQEETYEPLKTDANGRTNILAFGTSGYDMEGTEGDGTHDGAQLTDSIMVISLDQETGDVAMLSLPRDLKASPTCTATGKINEVYWCNNMDDTNEQAGAEALIEEVSSILGIDFQYYAHVNWGSLVSIVDTLGGITVTVDEDINDYYAFNAGGTYDLDGEKALWLARIRYGTANGDFTRSASQQKILIGIKDKILAKSLSIPDLLSLASTLGDNLRTNFSVSELKTLAHLTSEFDFNNMRQVSLIEPEKYVTTGNINGISYVIPVGGAGYYKAIQDYVAKMFSSDPRVYEDASILVLNGTDTAGIASTEEANLTTNTYTNIYTDNAPEGDYKDKYTLYALTAEKPGSQKYLEDKYGVQAQSADNLPAGIDTTCDFVLILGDDYNA